MTVISRLLIMAMRSKKAKMTSLNLDRLYTILAITKLSQSKPRSILRISELLVNLMQIATICFVFKLYTLFS